LAFLDKAEAPGTLIMRLLKLIQRKSAASGSLAHLIRRRQATGHDNPAPADADVAVT
jgi:hypothetical protein